MTIDCRAICIHGGEFPRLSYSNLEVFLIGAKTSDAASFVKIYCPGEIMANGIAHRYAAARMSTGRSLPWPVYIGIMSLVWLPVLIVLAQLFFP